MYQFLAVNFTCLHCLGLLCSPRAFLPPNRSAITPVSIIVRSALIFRVTPFRKDQSPESEKRKKVNLQRPSPRFRSEHFWIRGEMFCMEMSCWSSSGWAPTWLRETNRNICHCVLLQKREYITRRELKNIKIILFLIHELFRLPNFPK